VICQLPVRPPDLSLPCRDVYRLGIEEADDVSCSSERFCSISLGLSPNR